MKCYKCEEHKWGKPRPVMHKDDGKGYCLFHAPEMYKGIPDQKFNREVFKRIRESGSECDLSGTIFPSDISFHSFGKNSPLPDIDFEQCIFNGDADFNNVNFGSYADFNNAMFKKEAIFKSTHFKEWANFDDATLSSISNFNDITAHQQITFKRAKFTGLADFIDAKFLNIVDFSLSTFSSNSTFKNAEFEDVATFDNANFIGGVSFSLAKFHGVASFSDVKFCSLAVDLAIFYDSASFLRSEIINDASFTGSRFYKEVEFRSTRFNAEADFSYAKFNGTADFNDIKSSKNEILFHKISSGNIANIDFSSREVVLFSFTNCYWPEMLYPEIAKRYNELLNELQDDVNFILSNWSTCEELYRCLKLKASDDHNQVLVSKWHYREKLMMLEKLKERLSYKRWWFHWLNIYHKMCGFGENWLPAAGWFVGMLVFCFFVLAFFGVKSTPNHAGIYYEIEWQWGASLTVRESMNNFGTVCLSLLKYLLLIKEESIEFKPIYGWAEFLILLFTRLLIPIQAAFFAVALRNAYRR